jgi:NAD-dependent dihydropyrimidine dehydrogenase PreA subunit
MDYQLFSEGADPMKLHLPFPRQTKTKYIEINTHLCQACWRCIEVCPHHVLGKVELFGHRHVRIDDVQACKGCKACVRDCPHGAIQYIYVPKTKRELKTT